MNKILKSLAIAVFAVVPYLGILNAPFTFDDTVSVRHNLGVQLEHWWYPVRAVTHASYVLNHHLGGNHVLGYHVFNIALHAINSILLCLLTGSFWGAAIFAVHPLQTESVTYISQRSELFVGLFTLVGALVWRSRLKSSLAVPALIGIFLLGMESKESFVIFPLLLLLIPSQRSKADLWPFLFFGSAAVAWSLRNAANGFWTGVGASVHYLLTELSVLARYIALTVFPLHQNVDPAINPSLALVYIGAFLLLALIGFGIANRERGGNGILWFLLALAPTSTLIPIADPMAEHRLYVPLMGIAVLLAAIDRSELAQVAAVVACALLFSLTLHRNELWRYPTLLWSDAAEQSSDKPRPWINLAKAERDAGESDMALITYQEIQRRFAADREASTMAAVNAAAIDMHSGDPARLTVAQHSLERLLVAQGSTPIVEALPAFNDLAFVYVMRGHPAEALALIDTAASYDPSWILNASANFNRALAFAELGDCASADSAYAVAHRLDDSIPLQTCKP